MKNSIIVAITILMMLSICVYIYIMRNDNDMKTSEVGVELIKEFEGCRQVAYQDSVGVWTIGYGHTKDVYAGQLAIKKTI